MTVGLTGGIASGKSVVASIFRFLGIAIYDADMRAKWLIHHDPGVRSEIKKLFGPDAYDTKGDYNTTLVSKIVFSDSRQLHKLNDIVHPAVRKDYLDWLNTVQTPYSIHEAALIIESGYQSMMDEIILVTAPAELRIARLMKRNKLDHESARLRIQNQMTDEEKLKYADHIILNDQKTGLIDQCLRIHNILLKKCNE